MDSIVNEQRIAVMKRAEAQMRAYSGEITQATVRLIEVDQRVTVCNSEGVWA